MGGALGHGPPPPPRLVDRGGGGAAGHRAIWRLVGRRPLLVGAHAFCAGRWEGGRMGIAALGGAGRGLGARRADSPRLRRAGAPDTRRGLGRGEGAARARGGGEPTRRTRARARGGARGTRRALRALRAGPDRLRAPRHRRPRDQRHGRPGERGAAPCGPRPGGHRGGVRGDRGRAPARPRTTWDAWWRCSATRSAIGPAPDLALVEELVTRAAGSGLDVTLRLEGERDGFAAPVAQTAYRVVQEGLTNALRYASGAAISVLVRGDAGRAGRGGRELSRHQPRPSWPAAARATACVACASSWRAAAGGSRRAPRRTAAGACARAFPHPRG